MIEDGVESTAHVTYYLTMANFLWYYLDTTAKLFHIHIFTSEGIYSYVGTCLFSN
jgi:hypothetical protein